MTLTDYQKEQLQANVKKIQALSKSVSQRDVVTKADLEKTLLCLDILHSALLGGEAYNEAQTKKD
ncbi:MULTISPECIES: hypothetical protein [Aeromonas]|jgi:hypothetical protein|uniref:hypothetical protein n=1 Tax=Aeromonas TaxID=642 RepID=UPI00290D764E|nr:MULTISPECIES: hypothetical protein [Aeromonas]MDU4188819.1 hypothetical protein [Aeromonas sp.]MDU7781618.1 hypothetical protein [Aeromonas caviae]MDX7706787.1 hypothetical protein [Aeromonas caviae]MDX7796921.1 hypothetical protein [Aeromonas caviae]